MIVSCVLFAGCSTFGQKQNAGFPLPLQRAEILFVTAEGGLRLRSRPDLNSQRIITIPDKAEIRKLNEIGEVIVIADKAGKWVEIEYNKYKGWVFSGYLRKPEKPSVKTPIVCADTVALPPECIRRKSIERLQSAEIKPDEAEPERIILAGPFQFQDNWIQRQYGKIPTEKVSGSLHVVVHNMPRDLGPVQIEEIKGTLTWKKTLHIQKLLSEEIAALHESKYLIRLNINGYIVDVKRPDKRDGL